MRSKNRIAVGLLCAIALLCSSVALAKKNPSAVYCAELNYKYHVEETKDGQRGMCVLPDGKAVGAWAFLQGLEKPEYGYCALQKLPMRIVKDPQVCQSIDSDTCAVCLVYDEKNKVTEEVEVTTLMKLKL